MRRARITFLSSWVCLSSFVHAQEAPAGANALAASTTLSGYVSTSYHFGPDGGSDPYALAPANRNAFSMDVVGLSFQRPLDEWLFDTGFRIDMWLGPDASLLDSGASANTVELRQAYIDLRVPIADPRVVGGAHSLDLRLGVFDSPLGYESLDRNQNPHYTHSWGFTIEPTLHTGLLAMYPGVDALENGESDYLFSLGVANTVDPRIIGVAENVNRKTLLAGLTWLLPDSFGRLGGTAFSAGYVNGRARTGAETIQNLYLGVGLPLPSVRWSLGLVYDARILDGAANDDSVFGAYLGHRLNDKLSLNLRGEIFQDGAKLFNSESGAEQSDGHGLTATLDYNLWKNVTARLEYRWDHTDSPVNGRHNAQALHLNLIYVF
jgi:opacity protein-like surface antigen